MNKQPGNVLPMIIVVLCMLIALWLLFACPSHQIQLFPPEFRELPKENK